MGYEARYVDYWNFSQGYVVVAHGQGWSVEEMCYSYYMLVLELAASQTHIDVLLISCGRSTDIFVPRLSFLSVSI